MLARYFVENDSEEKVIFNEYKTVKIAIFKSIFKNILDDY